MILRLEDDDSPEEDMGVIILEACVTVSEGPTKRNVRSENKKHNVCHLLATSFMY